MFDYQKVSLAGMTYPVMEEFPHVTNIEEFIIHCARVSNPENQKNAELTGTGLVKYLIRNAHWSPFEMANMTMRIETTRDIARQMLRHRSFAFQEFSQRYASVEDMEFILREARLQDLDNKQNSFNTDDKDLIEWWNERQAEIRFDVYNTYGMALKKGIAKEQARAILPEGMTPSVLYMQGSVRSWIHYCELREKNGTQFEHVDIALKAKEVLVAELPTLGEYFNEQQGCST